MQAINPKKNPNYVHIDQIWKDHVRHEYQAWRDWPEKWGFISKEYIRMNHRLRGEPITPDPEDKYFYANCERGNEVVPADDSDSRQIQPSDQSISPNRSGATLKRASAYSNLPGIINGSSWRDKLSPDSTPNESILNVTDIDIEKSQSERLPLIKPGPPANVPRTTAAQIGWKQRSNLERFGKAPNARPYQGILKRFNWPTQGIM